MGDPVGDPVWDPVGDPVRDSAGSSLESDPENHGLAKELGAPVPSVLRGWPCSAPSDEIEVGAKLKGAGDAGSGVAGVGTAEGAVVAIDRGLGLASSAGTGAGDGESVGDAVVGAGVIGPKVPTTGAEDAVVDGFLSTTSVGAGVLGTGGVASSATPASADDADFSHTYCLFTWDGVILERITPFACVRAWRRHAGSRRLGGPLFTAEEERMSSLVLFRSRVKKQRSCSYH